MQEIKDQILDKINPQEYYQNYFPDLTFSVDGQSSLNMHCFMHDDTTPSLSISEQGGFCHGCGKGWKDPIGFTYLWNKNAVDHGKKAVPSYDNVVKSLYHKYVHPIVPNKLMNRWHKALMKSGTKRKLLKEVRLIEDTELLKYKIGYDTDDDRFTVPIFNKEGWITDIRKIRLNPGPRVVKNLPIDYLTAKEKRAAGETTHGMGGRLFPMSHLIAPTVTICEGEWDAILLNKNGVNAVTAGSVNDWRRFTPLLKGKHVTILFDNDVDRSDGKNPGQDTAQKLTKEVYKVAKSVRNVYFPSGDVSDYFLDGGTKTGLATLFKGTEVIEVKPEKVEATEVCDVDTIVDLVSDKYYGKRVSVDARLTGEKDEYYSLPKDYTLTCDMDRGNPCNSCPMVAHQGRIEGCIDPGSDTALGFIAVKDIQISAELFKLHDLPARCPKVRFTRQSVVNVHAIAVSPSMVRDNKKAEIDKLTVYNMSKKLEVNSEYTFEGRVTHDPNTQKSMFLVDKAEEKELSFRTFKKPRPDQLADLKKKFNPERASVEGIIRKHDELSDLLAHNVTYIYGRPQLHTAIDLTFHSPLEINFDGVVRNSYVETAIIGDTNTGKNEVLDRLCAYYGNGIVVDSAATTKAGLIGGSCPKGFFSWGLYVQQHGKLIGLDEGKHLSATIDAMRSIREGKADYINAYAKRQTVCKARLVLLANDPSGSLSANPYPIMALPSLFGAGADISRFTMAYFMREEDVSSEVMNRKQPPPIETDITQDDFRIRLANAWSIHHSNIVYEAGATAAVYKLSGEMSKKYHSRIPLVQSSTMKKKLPSLAAALALSQFNMNSTGDKCIVTENYVLAVRRILESHYDSDACQYNAYSDNEYLNSKITSLSAVDNLFKEEQGKAGSIKHSIRHLMAQKDIDTSYIQDSFLACDVPQTTNRFLKLLVVNRCLERNGKVYVKTKAFVDYLKKKQKEK